VAPRGRERRSFLVPVLHRLRAVQDITVWVRGMANLTLTIDEDALRRARIRALEHGTSVNAVVREFLESYAGSEREREA